MSFEQLLRLLQLVLQSEIHHQFLQVEILVVDTRVSILLKKSLQFLWRELLIELDLAYHPVHVWHLGLFQASGAFATKLVTLQ